MTYDEWSETDEGCAIAIRISQQTVGVVSTALEAGFKAGAAAEGARIRGELLEDLGEDGVIERRHLIAALNRIIPEEG